MHTKPETATREKITCEMQMQMGLKEKKYEIDLSQGMVQWWTPVNTLMNLQIP